MVNGRRGLLLGLPLVVVLVLSLVVLVQDERGEPSGSSRQASTDICSTDEEGPGASRVGFDPPQDDKAVEPVVPASALEATDLELAWADEFTGDSVDLRVWSTRECWHQSPGFINDSQAWLPFPATSDNLVQRGGAVRLQARRDQEAVRHGQVMTTAVLTTRKRFDTFTHGVVEARMKIPEGRGLWPAFWLMGNGTGSEGWPETGEIDIFEFVNNASGGTGGCTRPCTGARSRTGPPSPTTRPASPWPCRGGVTGSTTPSRCTGRRSSCGSTSTASR
jgi:hypothetical protein